jgi:hypothetical protein
MGLKEVVKTMRGFDWVYLGSLLFMLFMISFGHKIGLRIYGSLFAVVLFTALTIFQITQIKTEGKEVYAEHLIFLLIFVVYSILSLALSFRNMELVSPLNLVFLILLFVCFLYLTAMVIWSKILINNNRNPLFLISAYVALTFIIITIFVGLYAGIGDLGYNGQVLSKANITNMDYYYFSMITFTGVGYGDYYPVGASRVVAMIESYLGMLFNVVIIGVIMNRIIKGSKRKS